ncbi:MAG TPA: TraR/DksA family transcriptional regulator [Planctomycetota bacterium]
MPKAKQAKYKKLLLSILSELGVKLEAMEEATLRGDNDTTPDEYDEFGSDSYGTEFQLDLIQNEEEILRDVHEALERIANGSFGNCDGCAEPIPERRLQVLPYARNCVGCQRKVEEGDEIDED